MYTPRWSLRKTVPALKEYTCKGMQREVRVYSNTRCKYNPAESKVETPRLGVKTFIKLVCHFKLRIEAHWQRLELLCRQAVCRRLFNWLLGRNFNWIPVRIQINWIAAGLQRAGAAARRSEGLVWLWSLYNKLEQEVIRDETHTPRTKQPHTHTQAHVCTQAKTQKKDGQFGM